MKRPHCDPTVEPAESRAWRMAKPGTNRRVVVTIEPLLTTVLYEEARPCGSDRALFRSGWFTISEVTDPDTDRAWAMAHLQAADAEGQG